MARESKKHPRGEIAQHVLEYASRRFRWRKASRRLAKAQLPTWIQLSPCLTQEPSTIQRRRLRKDLEAQNLPFEDFVIQDIRRTCRTRFSALPVEDIVRELLMAHARPGLRKVYDLHAYEKEKADALKLWHVKILAILRRDLRV